MGMRFAALAALVLTLAFAGAVAAEEPWAGLRVTPMTFKPAAGAEVEAERGEFWVPENRADPKSRPIKLVFVRFKSTAAQPGPPLVYLAGGPGGSGIATARGARHPIFLALRAAGDVIAFDQRGTGASNNVPFCADPPQAGVLDLTRAPLIASERARFPRCWAFWKGRGVAIDAYNTVESAADLEDLRKVLGAKRLNIWGISYGSHLGLAFVKRYPRSVERIALASLEGLDQTVKLPAAVDPVIGRYSQQMLGDDSLVTLMRRVHAKLDAAPAEATFTPRGAAAPITVRFDSFGVRMFAGGMIADPYTAAVLPSLYGALDAGGYGPIAQQMYGAFSGGGPLGLRGMPEAMDLASGISPARQRLVDEQAKTAVLGDALNYPMPQVAGVIPGADLGEGFRARFRSRVPALFISGTLDGRTPLSEQAQVISQFANAKQLIVENAGHNVLETDPQIAAILTAFFRGEPVTTLKLTLPPMKPVRAATAPAG
jgi:pimeloyl-ACP methyl ester carboxylesterase